MVPQGFGAECIDIIQSAIAPAPFSRPKTQEFRNFRVAVIP